ncbi:hypothetical protein ACWNT8_14950 [Pigmentibacter ruber]
MSSELYPKSLLYDIKVNDLKAKEDNPKEAFLKAYKSHKKAAICLFNANLFRDAYLSLIIASECLLKGIFNSLKVYLFGTVDDKKQSRIMIESIYKKQREEFLSVKEFKHDLILLISTIKDLFSEFDKGKYSDHYVKFTNAIDAKINWQEERYTDPNYYGKETKRIIDWQMKSKELLESLN